jgi:CubicO group peptidase (beta-lactamase class C family)
MAWAKGPLPYSKPEEVGLSSARLNRITDRLQEDVDNGKLIGAVALIARKGKIAYFQTFGYQDKIAGKLMRKDSIFRLYSMSKPVTSVALMMLYEEGRIDLFEPLEKYLPEFKDQKVAVIGKGADGKPTIVKTVPVKRKTTIQDVFRHTGGLTYGFTGHPVDKLYRDKGVSGSNQTLAEFSAKLGPLPLMWEPGTLWHYSYSHDIQARLVEVISGMPFDKFLEERIYKPLGMKDTGHYVKEVNLGRFTKFAQVKDKKTGKMVAHPLDKAFSKPPKLLSGGGGLVSTASDYLRFATMLLNGGEFNGVRLLSPKTIAFMASDHLGSIPQNDLYHSLGTGYGYGLGVGVRTAPGMATQAGSVGDYYWGGYAGTYFWIDPKEEMVAMMLFQDPANRMHYRRMSRSLVYQAFIE